jgi:uncharacterized protein with HEPN domain
MWRDEAYLHIDLSTLWDTIQNDLVNLITKIEPLVPRKDQT